MSESSSSSGGIGIGGIIAGIWSWSTNGSVLWCIFHIICGWFYIFYRLGGCGAG